MTLGKRIAAMRKDRKLSQEYVAESLGVSRQAVSKWENDLTAPDTENLIALAKLLGTDVEFLASGALTEDMVSDPLPEPEFPSPAPAKKTRNWIALCLAVSILAAAVFGWLWYREARDHTTVEELCTASANFAFQSFRDCRDGGDDHDYWSAVADFRTFEQTLKVLINEDAVPSSVSSGDYSVCNQIYGFMLLEPERVRAHLELVTECMAGLSRDIYSVQAWQRMYELRNLLEHGA